MFPSRKVRKFESKRRRRNIKAARTFQRNFDRTCRQLNGRIHYFVGPRNMVNPAAYAGPGDWIGTGDFYRHYSNAYYLPTE